MKTLLPLIVLSCMISCTIGPPSKTVSHNESDSKDYFDSGTTHKEQSVQISPNGEKVTKSTTVEKPAQP